MKTTVCLLVIVAACTDLLHAQSVKMQPAVGRPADPTIGAFVWMGYDRSEPKQPAEWRSLSWALMKKPAISKFDFLSQQADNVRLEGKYKRAGVSLEKAIQITIGDDLNYSMPAILPRRDESAAFGSRFAFSPADPASQAWTIGGVDYGDFTHEFTTHSSYRLRQVFAPKNVAESYVSLGGVSDDLADRHRRDGSANLRGFKYRDLGPKDSQGKPTGGNALSRLAAEWKVDGASAREPKEQSKPLPAEAAALALKAREQFARGDYREAEKTYDQALAMAPDNLQLLSNKAIVLLCNQKYESAEQILEAAIAVAPKDDLCHCLFGICQYRLGKIDAAISALTKTLAIDPKNATAHHYLSILATQKGWVEAGRKELETALTLELETKLR